MSVYVCVPSGHAEQPAAHLPIAAAQLARCRQRWSLRHEARYRLPPPPPPLKTASCLVSGGLHLCGCCSALVHFQFPSFVGQTCLARPPRAVRIVAADRRTTTTMTSSAMGCGPHTSISLHITTLINSVSPRHCTARTLLLRSSALLPLPLSWCLHADHGGWMSTVHMFAFPLWNAWVRYGQAGSSPTASSPMSSEIAAGRWRFVADIIVARLCAAACESLQVAPQLQVCCPHFFRNRSGSAPSCRINLNYPR